MCYFVLRTSPGWISDNATNTNVELLKGNVTSAFGIQLWLPTTEQNRIIESNFFLLI